jgi:hypothetical protein
MFQLRRNTVAAKRKTDEALLVTTLDSEPVPNNIHKKTRGNGSKTIKKPDIELIRNIP